MGIADAIARVRKGVKTGRIPGVVAELSGQLRSPSIPAALRPAASRIADLLRVPDAARTPVPLVPQKPPHAVTPDMQESACPFTGAKAGAQVTEIAAPSAPPQAEPAASQPERAAPPDLRSTLDPLGQAGSDAEASSEDTPRVVEAAPVVSNEVEAAPVVEPEVVVEVPEAPAAEAAASVEAAPAARAASEEPTASSETPVSKGRESKGAAARAKDAQPAVTDGASKEKTSAELAGKPGPAKTAARSGNRAAGKQQGGKGKKKKK